jgi:uncharacterized Zn-binding protein involved in type VI secretion
MGNAVIALATNQCACTTRTLRDVEHGDACIDINGQTLAVDGGFLLENA